MFTKSPLSTATKIRHIREWCNSNMPSVTWTLSSELQKRTYLRDSSFSHARHQSVHRIGEASAPAYRLQRCWVTGTKKTAQLFLVSTCLVERSVSCSAFKGKGKARPVGEEPHVPHCAHATWSRMEHPSRDIRAVGTCHESDALAGSRVFCWRRPYEVAS